MKVSAGGPQIDSVSPDDRGPAVLRPPAARPRAVDWLEENRSRIEAILRTRGGVILRDFGLNSVAEFNRVVRVFSDDLLDYVHRSTPRTRVGGKLYTATEYPADRTIPLHNENSYTDAWPDHIYFFCAMAAQEGGETPTADARRVYEAIDPEARERFERTGVLYVRNFTEGIDLSWQEVFQTTDRAEVDAYCAAHRIDAQWRDGDPLLRTSQRCPAILRHPHTGETVWFNQAHLFHISALAADEQASLVDELGVENVPRNAFYGDGSPIEPEILEHVRDAYEREKVAFAWQKGDVLILDNVLIAHGRNPYRGFRKIVVAMS